MNTSRSSLINTIFLVPKDGKKYVNLKFYEDTQQLKTKERNISKF